MHVILLFFSKLTQFQCLSHKLIKLHKIIDSAQSAAIFFFYASPSYCRSLVSIDYSLAV